MPKFNVFATLWLVTTFIYLIFTLLAYETGWSIGIWLLARIATPLDVLALVWHLTGLLAITSAARLVFKFKQTKATKGNNTSNDNADIPARCGTFNKMVNNKHANNSQNKDNYTPTLSRHDGIILPVTKGCNTNRGEPLTSEFECEKGLLISGKCPNNCIYYDDGSR